MRRYAFMIVFGLIAALAGLSAAGVPVRSQDRVVQVPTEDAEMRSAIDKARNSLAEFWTAFDARKPGDEGFALKIAITDGRKTEHFWVNDIVRTGPKITGIINNDPNDVSTVKLGDRVDVASDRISDWMYLRNGKIIGNATLRVLLKFMPKDQAERYRAMLDQP